jgi:hypothetical protein
MCWRRVTDSDSNGNSYSHTDANGNVYAYSDINIYRHTDANSHCDGNYYTDTETYTHAKSCADAEAAFYAAATPLSSKISWLDSQTRERKLASSCLWIEPTVLL